MNIRVIETLRVHIVVIFVHKYCWKEATADVV